MTPFFGSVIELICAGDDYTTTAVTLPNWLSRKFGIINARCAERQFSRVPPWFILPRDSHFRWTSFWGPGHNRVLALLPQIGQALLVVVTALIVG